MDTKIKIVLVRPQHPGNIGAVSRVMMNMGLLDLILVNPRVSPKSKEAISMASGADLPIKRSKVYKNLSNAMKGVQWAVGTTRRQGKYRKDVLSPREFARWVKKLPQGETAAVLFGPERTGLSNEELAVCQKIVTIPTSEEFPSINLSQAVMIIAYELLLSKSNPEKKRRIPLATTDQNERLYTHLNDTLRRIGFLKPAAEFRMMQKIRHLFNKAYLTKEDVAILHGICRQIDWASRSGA